jgi:hypothetical protein
MIKMVRATTCLYVLNIRAAMVHLFFFGYVQCTYYHLFGILAAEIWVDFFIGSRMSVACMMLEAQCSRRNARNAIGRVNLTHAAGYIQRCIACNPKPAENRVKTPPKKKLARKHGRGRRVLNPPVCRDWPTA